MSSSKRDRDDYAATLLDAPGSPPQDPEDKPTNLWAPVAGVLFRPEGVTNAAAARTTWAGAIDREASEGNLPPEEMDSEPVTDPLAPRGAPCSPEEEETWRQVAKKHRRVPVPREVSGTTVVVQRPSGQAKLQHECRMCGRKIARPVPRRLRGSIRAAHGFRCEVCHNVFCAADVVRVSSLFESLMYGGRFRCLLCMPPKPR